MAMPRHTARLSLTQQALDLRGRFPQGTVRLTAARLVWIGTIQPTALSRTYRVQVTYRTDRLPQVRVLDVLEGRPGEPLPHVYNDGTLCLHLPGEWAPDMFIVDSTLAWTAEWLFNYEVWKATGEWHGGGEWPPIRRTDGPPPIVNSGVETSPAGAISERR
jgi:hypothetical protein